MTSDEWWEGLDAGIRDQLAQIIKEVTETRNSESFAVNEANKQKIIEAGGVVRTLTPDVRQAWIEALQPVWSKFEDDIGADLIAAAQASNDGS